MNGTISETVSPRTSYKLDRMHAFLRELGNPERAYPIVHVGGTSGKGSTSTMIAAALQAAGKRTALHVKPHLHSMTERARIDGTPVSEERFAALLNEMMPAIERTAPAFGRPTYYETLLALAYLHFAREAVDVAVLEVGLGGRLDGTNTILPALAAITSVGYDHTEVLGSTLEAIAAEKAGIAKPGVPLVVGDLPSGALAVVERIANEAGAPVIRAWDGVSIVNVRNDVDRQAFDVVTPRARYALTTPALGAFQRGNAVTAIAVLERLPAELAPSAGAIVAGFAALSIPGRMEILKGRGVPVVFDIAHNPEKAQRLLEAMRERFPERRFRYVVAVSEGKDAQGVVSALQMPRATFTFTTFATPGRKALSADDLAAAARARGIEAQSIDDPYAALRAVFDDAGESDAVVVTGSTFVVAELREWFATTAA
ncbi:MAG: bifunctional folylpolyglutamate synthase/dihydrofolate synthase, partial [Candidatus Eremiobacteraeota bacterium]|nr:bifunctional folylpolyglutamate synthase/dihydrofolate synthase [Candidatus Eremiobacteraeota bacterium]